MSFIENNVSANDLPTDGVFQINHPNGKLYLKGELIWEITKRTESSEKYSGGRPVGIWKYYGENGSLKAG